MIVIDDMLSKINDYHRMSVLCVRACVRVCLCECDELEKRKFESNCFGHQTKRTYIHALYLTHSAQVDSILFCGHHMGGIYVRLSTVIIPFDWK